MIKNFYPARLVTRTKESNMYASLRVVKLEGEMKVIDVLIVLISECDEIWSSSI